MDVEWVVPGVWRAGTRYVNWYVIDADLDGVTVVDTGLPGYRHQLDGAVRATGRQIEDVAAVLLTHGHVDHAGGAGAFPAGVHVHPADVDNLEVPGTPRVLHTPGHTAGSCVFEFPDHGVATMGDALCTVSPFSGRTVDPELQTRGSNRDCDRALASLDRLLELEVPVLLPGHGRPWHDGAETAVASAKRVGCR